MTKLRRAWSLVLLGLLSTAPAFAQGTTGAIEGKVADEQGLPLPGATATAQNTSTGFTRSAVSDAVGTFRVPGLPVGNYDVKVELAGFAAVLLENVPADGIGTPGMETLAAWVRDGGAGLMMTGGKKAYGPGGYFKSPLESVLPVSMELRREHRKLALAIVVALDRSGSMAVPVAGGEVLGG